MKNMKLVAFLTVSLLSSLHATEESVNSFPQVSAALSTINEKIGAVVSTVKEQGMKIKNLEAATVKAQINALKDYLLEHKLVTGAVAATVVATALYFYMSSEEAQTEKN